MKGPVVIIGGGVSGIVQAKWLLEIDNSTKIILVEQESDFGGVWDVKRRNGVMDCTICNVSKYVMELTDFPWSKDSEDFPHHSRVLSYIRDYVTRYLSSTRLECRFNCRVMEVTYGRDKTVKVVYKDLLNHESKSIEARHVIVANGHSKVPNYPLPNVDQLNFVSHSANYKNCEMLNLFEKNVLVVGVSFSAVDVAVDLVTQGNNKVSVLTRNGSWFAPKTDKSSIPTDLKLPRIFTHLPSNVQNQLIKLNLNTRYFNQNNWEVPNSCEPTGGSLVNSEKFVSLVQEKRISVLHGCLSDIKDSGDINISLADGSCETLEFDHVIFCTGFKTVFEFLDDLEPEGESTSNGYYPYLYLNMIPPRHSDILSFIGLFNVRYTSPFQVIDLQAQYTAYKLAGVIKLPDKQSMIESIRSEKSQLQRDCKTFRASLFLPSDYRDVLATKMGMVPSVWDFLKSPKMCIEYYLGPITWAGYRLTDPQLSKPARDSLHKTCDRAFHGSWWFVKFNVAILGTVLLTLGMAVLASEYS